MRNIIEIRKYAWQCPYCWQIGPAYDYKWEEAIRGGYAVHIKNCNDYKENA